MQALQLETTPEKFVVSIDKNIITKELLVRMFERVRIEYLAQKIDFDEDITEIGEEIKTEWWKNNKEQFIKRT
jgi:hypothetical protein